MLVIILVFIGGLNWGLVGLGMILDMDLNVVKMLLGTWPIVEAIVYLVVGLAAIMMLVAHLQKKCTMCTCESKATAPTPEPPAGETPAM